MMIADVVRFLAKDGDGELDCEAKVDVDPDKTGFPEIRPRDELEGLMVEFDPVGNMVLTSGTPDEVYDIIEAVMAPFVALVEAVMTPSLDPVGNTVLTSGTPDEVYDIIEAVTASAVALTEAVRLPLLEPRDTSTGTTVATVDSFADIELTREFDSYAERDGRSEAMAETGTAVVSEPETIRVALTLPVVSVVSDEMSVVIAELVGAVPATPGKVMPETILATVAGLAVFSAESYEESDAPDKPWISDVPEEAVVAAVPIAGERDTPGGAVVAIVDDVVSPADEPEDVEVRVDSATDDMPVEPIVSRDAEVEDAEFAVLESE